MLIFLKIKVESVDVEPSQALPVLKITSSESSNKENPSPKVQKEPVPQKTMSAVEKMIADLDDVRQKAATPVSVATAAATVPMPEIQNHIENVNKRKNSLRLAEIAKQKEVETTVTPVSALTSVTVELNKQPNPVDNEVVGEGKKQIRQLRSRTTTEAATSVVTSSTTTEAKAPSTTATSANTQGNLYSKFAIDGEGK